MSHNCQLPSVLASLSLYCVITTTQPLQLYPADDSAHPHIIFRLRAAAVHAKISQLRCTSENIDTDPRRWTDWVLAFGETISSETRNLFRDQHPIIIALRRHNATFTMRHRDNNTTLPTLVTGFIILVDQSHHGGTRTSFD